MTHETEPDPNNLADADAAEIEAPLDAVVEQLEDVPVGAQQDAVFDYDPDAELEKGMRGPEPDPDSLADPTLDVVVQMGHVDRTSGITGTAGEQVFTKAAAGHTAALLLQAGRTVKVIKADENVPQSQVFVAIHCDGHSNTSASGASVGYLDNKGKKGATAWKEAYQRAGWPRGFRQDNLTAGLSSYYGNKKAVRAGTPTAFVLEAGFLTNPEDRALLANDAGHLRCATAIRDAVAAILGAGSGGGPGPVVPPFPGTLRRRSSSGSNVCLVQGRLRELGHSIAVVDGCPFGPQTEIAVKAFQVSRGLNVPQGNIGAVDKTTWDALFS